MAASIRINLKFPSDNEKLGAVWGPRLGCHMKLHLCKFDSIIAVGQACTLSGGGVTFSRALGGEQRYNNSASYSPQLLGGPGHVSHVPRVQWLTWTPTATLSKGIFSFRRTAQWMMQVGRPAVPTVAQQKIPSILGHFS